MNSLLQRLGLKDENPGVFCGDWLGGGAAIEKVSPIDGRVVATVRKAAAKDYEAAVSKAATSVLTWRSVPAPVRGDLVRQLGNALRAAKSDLAQLVTIETGLLAIRSGEKSIRFRPVLDITPETIEAAMGLLREQCRRLRAPLKKAA